MRLAGCALAASVVAACSLTLPFAQLTSGADSGPDAGEDEGAHAGPGDGATDVCPGAVAVIDGGASSACAKVPPGACMPRAPAPYPGWVPPNAPAPLCTTEQLDQVFADCFEPGKSSQAACVGFGEDPANDVCNHCIFQLAAPGKAYAPEMVLAFDAGGFVLEVVNLPGCIVLFDPCQQACAEAAQAAYWCENSACQACPTLAEEVACGMFVEGCSCSPAVAVYIQCTLDLVANKSPAAACLNLDSNVLSRVTITKACGGL